MNQRGFTLIELMVAMALIAILAGIVWPSYSRWQDRESLSESIMFMKSALSSARLRSVQQGLPCSATPTGSCNSLYFGVEVGGGGVKVVRFCDANTQVCKGKTPADAVESDEITNVWEREFESRVSITKNAFTSSRLYFNKGGGVYGSAGSVILSAGGHERCVVVSNSGRIKKGEVNGNSCD